MPADFYSWCKDANFVSITIPRGPNEGMKVYVTFSLLSQTIVLEGKGLNRGVKEKVSGNTFCFGQMVPVSLEIENNFFKKGNVR